jgi:hypothetical protein
LNLPLLRGLLLLLALSASLGARAFDLEALNSQLRTHPVLRGDFVQEKYLRALPQPLLSRGQFVLARDQGLLWLLRSPLQQDYRISAKGIARRGADGWQPARGHASERQNRLILALLSGDGDALAADFTLQLAGSAEAWTLSLTPRGALLGQIFSQVRLSGGQAVEQIEIVETQGDRTLMRLEQVRSDATLSDTERHDFLD